MAKPGPILMWSQYLALRTVSTALTACDVDLNLKSIDCLVHTLYAAQPGFVRKFAERSKANLRRSFPEWDEQRVDDTARDSLAHLVKFCVEVLHTPRLIHPVTVAERVTRGPGLDEALAILDSDRPVILVTGHLGNFELLGTAIASLGYRIEALARPLDNPLIYDWLLGMREKLGMRVITKWDATDRMVEVLRSRGALGFIADQNAGDKGTFVPFMGRLASAYKSIAVIAQLHDAAIICGYAQRTGPGFRYEVGTTDIILPEQWADQHDPTYYITARYTKALESAVRLCPEQYWWMHRRWKSRPRFELEGKPMPKSMRCNLEALPWMTPGLMEQLALPIA